MCEVLEPRPGSRRVVVLGAVALAAMFAVAWTVTSSVPEDSAGDFFFNLWEPGRALLDGGDPFRTSNDESGGVYPPAAVVMALPFALLPYEAAAVVWTAMLLASTVGALRVVGVRDWRCFALALASPPVVQGVAYGNVSLLVLLALAYMWVARKRPLRAGLVLGFLIATRIFLWPLLFWLLATRRLRAAAAAAASGVAVSLIGWAAVGFRRIDEFPAVVRNNASEFMEDGVSVASIVANLGASASVASLVALLAGAIALGVAWLQRSDDLACFSWALAAALFASPLVWGHYYALMLVPIAVSTPTLSRKWLLPYLTAPQLTTVAPTAGERIFDAVTGVAFTIATAWQARGREKDPARSQPLALPEPVEERLIPREGV